MDILVLLLLLLWLFSDGEEKKKPTPEPEPQPEPEPKPENPYKWIRGLLTLKPKPSTQQAKDLGFNLIVPYTGLLGGWTGKIIPCSRNIRDNEEGIVGYVTCDEPDCRKHNPQNELGEYKRMKEETTKPVGLLLCGDIGCGVEGTAGNKKAYKEEWIEVANQVDFVCLDVYPYREDWPDPVVKMEEFHKFYQEKIRVPIIIIIQAHWGRWHLTKPNPMEQVKFWVDKGYGYVVYPWKDEKNGVVNMQEEWKQANNYAKGVNK